MWYSEPGVGGYFKAAAMPFISQIGATRVVILGAALLLARSALSQTQPETITQRTPEAYIVSDDVGRAQLDSFGPADDLLDSNTDAVSGYESVTSASLGEAVIPAADETPANRFESAPFDRSGSALFQNSTGNNTTGSARSTNSGYPTLNWSGFLQVDTGVALSGRSK